MGNVKSLIREAIRRNGFEVRSRYSLRSLQDFQPTPTAGWTLELIGTRGVGKSTLFNRCQATLKRRWFFRSHLRDLVLTELNSADAANLHRHVLFSRLAELGCTLQDPWQSITAVSQCACVAYESMLVASHTFPRGFALEEGFFKNFPQEILNLDDATSLPIWRGTCLVYLRASAPDIVIQRYQRRRAQRLAKGSYQHEESKDELSARVESDTHRYDQIIEKAKAFGNPTLVVDVQEHMSSAVKAVLSFESSLFASKAVSSLPEEAEPGHQSSASNVTAENQMAADLCKDQM